jgi:hypothetical protein
VFILINKKFKGQAPLALDPFDPKNIWGLKAMGLLVSLKRKLGVFNPQRLKLSTQKNPWLVSLKSSCSFERKWGMLGPQLLKL